MSHSGLRREYIHIQQCVLVRVSVIASEHDQSDIFRVNILLM